MPKDVLVRFEHLLDDYFHSDKPQTAALPLVAYCAGELHLSPNYFGDLVKRETGKSVLESIEVWVIVEPGRVLEKDHTTLGVIYVQKFIGLSFLKHH